MKAKKMSFLIVIVLSIFIGGYYFASFFFNSSEKNLENETAELVLSSKDLVASYTNNESKSNSLYTGKIIEVTGHIK